TTTADNAAPALTTPEATARTAGAPGAARIKARPTVRIAPQDRSNGPKVEAIRNPARTKAETAAEITVATTPLTTHRAVQAPTIPIDPATHSRARTAQMTRNLQEEICTHRTITRAAEIAKVRHSIPIARQAPNAAQMLARAAKAGTIPIAASQQAAETQAIR